MARRRRATKRNISPDPVYGNVLVTKLINQIMKDGKKSVAQSQIYRAFKKVEAKNKKKDPVDVFEKALDNIRPSTEVRPRRIGGAAYQIPMPVKGERRDTLAIRWLVQAARSKSSTDYKTFADKLASEVLDAQKGEGAAVKKREDVEKMAEANRAFAHFRW